MTDDVFTLIQQTMRGADSNSLLRLYDRARDIVRRSPSQRERTRAGKALQRLTKELQKRDVPFMAGLQ